MTDTKFVYVTYISSTAEKVWDALTKAEITRNYWGHENVSDWRAGSSWQHVRADESRSVDLVGNVIESAPPHRLVMTWQSPANAAAKARPSRVAFDIERIADMIRLTVTHDDLVAGSEMEQGIVAGWPRVLSSLKSYLETGRPLDTWAKPKAA
jgi:uncharacterized protein YndB with AHSA1/START domain